MNSHRKRARFVNRARLAGMLAAVAAAIALVALPGAAAAHHDHEGVADAGTIESFDQETGVLTIALTEGGSVSGLVTPRTHIHCDEGWHFGRHGLRHGHHATASHDRGEKGESGDHHEGGDEPPGHAGTPPGHDADHSGGCDTSDLTAGATVKFAVLMLVDGKAVYAVVGLPRPEGK